MAKIQSAKKALRVSQRRRIFNLRRKSAMKDAIKKINKLIEAKSKDAALSLASVQKAIDKAASRGTIKKNAAARIKSRLAKRLKALAT